MRTLLLIALIAAALAESGCVRYFVQCGLSHSFGCT